jgi:hypothetical protein
MIDRLISAVVALTLGILVWLYARSRDQELLDNVPIPVEISLASGQVDQYLLDITGPSQVPVSFRGPPSRIRELRGLLQRGELTVTITVAVPEDRLNESRYSDTVRIDPADLHVPPGVAPTIVEVRNRIPVTLHRLVERRLPVRLDPAPPERVSRITLEPATVRVRGPQDVLDRVRSVPTQPFLFPPSHELNPAQEVPVAGPVPLVREMDGRPVRPVPDSVTVHLIVQPEQRLYELPDVPIRFLCPANFPLKPQFVSEAAGKMKLKILGPVLAEPPAVVAYIDLTGRKWVAGLYGDEPIRLQLPKDTQLGQNPPRSAPFRLMPTAEPRTRDPLPVP